MLSPQDDLIGHQVPAPFATKPADGHPDFTERYWYTAHPIDGTPIILDLGMGYYPNKGVMDAFAGVTIGRKQHNFRASRQLGSQPLETAVGPLRYQVLEGMKRHRITLAQGNGNDSGISFELEFEASFPAAQEKQSYREREGKVDENMVRVAQFGRWRGWLVAGGQRYEVTPDKWWGQRDHSWGIRAPMYTDEAKPPVAVHKKFFWTWSMFQFEDACYSIFLKERERGKPWYISGAEYRKEGGKAVHREMTSALHDIEWADDKLGQSITRAVWTFDFDSGPQRVVTMETLPTRFYLKGGLYGGYRGWNHGDDKGDYYSECDVWDLEDATMRLQARTLSDHIVRCTCDGKTGHGVSEYGVASGYPLYTEPQKFAAM